MKYKYQVKETAVIGNILFLGLIPKKGNRLINNPGQYAGISFRRNGKTTPVRCFSITSTPSSQVLRFAMRIGGNFTHAAAELKVGDLVYVQGPFGNFVIDRREDKRIVMLAAGIGITPMMSMIRYAAENRFTIPITLLFSNRYANNIPFLEELRELHKQNPYFTAHFFVTDEALSKSEYYKDLIFEYTGDKHIEELTSNHHVGSTYFICGPKSFTETMYNSLTHYKVDPNKIVTETFAQETSLSLGTRFSIRNLTYAFTAAAIVLTTGLITVMDLSRYVPRVAAETTGTTHTTSSKTITNSSSGSSTSSSGSSTSSSGGSSTTGSSTSTNTATTTPTTVKNQTPVSSVS
jgi:ferredoxin-NADP reductase